MCQKSNCDMVISLLCHPIASSCLMLLFSFWNPRHLLQTPVFKNVFETLYDLQSDRSRESRKPFYELSLNKRFQDTTRKSLKSPLKIALVWMRLKVAVGFIQGENRGYHHKFIQLHIHTGCYFNGSSKSSFQNDFYRIAGDELVRNFIL